MADPVPDDLTIVARALGESEAVRPAREALARIEAALGALDTLRADVTEALARSDRTEALSVVLARGRRHEASESF